MRESTDRALLLAQHLLSENRIGGRSWREIALKDYHDRVHFVTLNRIALSNGKWLPKDRKTLRALGLVEPKPRTEIQKAISRMVRQTNKDVLANRKDGNHK